MAKLRKDPRLVTYGETNLGTPLEIIDSLVVPTDRFFVRSNGPTPEIKRDDWTLVVDGAVYREIEIDFPTLFDLPHRTLTAFLECTGNGRSRFKPVTEGTTWKDDAAGNAVWTGVSLRDVLGYAGPRPSAVDVVTQGADLAEMRRGLPMNVALEPDTLLVFEMNGEPLPAEHGGPVRLFVPRWAGIASTKWLTRLEVWEKPFTGPFQGDLYVLFDEDGAPVATIGQMPVKSVIAEPLDGQTVAGLTVSVRGFGWSGYAGISVVEVNIDGDQNWLRAEIVESAGPLSWCCWRLDVELTPGAHRISARATDERGLQQPRRAFWNQKGYLMNEIQTVTINVDRLLDG